MGGLKAVCISGHIASGKSTLARELAHTMGWSRISFGAFVKAEAVKRDLEPERAVLQDLGQTLIENLGVDEFLRGTLEYAKPASNVHIFDGLRHVAMLEAIEAMYFGNVRTVFIEVDPLERYQRNLGRNYASDSGVDLDGFMQMSTHKVVQDLQVISRRADLNILGSDPLPVIKEIVLGDLRRSGYL